MKNVKNKIHKDSSNYLNKLNEVIKNPEKHTYRELRKIATKIYNDSSLSRDDIAVLEEKLAIVERLFSYKKIEPLLAIIVMIITVLLTSQNVYDELWIQATAMACLAVSVVAIILKY